MFFGLTNSPATFQNMMNDLLRDLVDKGNVIVYIDDIMIFTVTIEEHCQIVREVLRVLKDNQLFLKAEKCTFEALEVEYLGLLVSEGQVRMDPIKVKGVADWPKPKNKKDIQSFLGFANFYQRFIKGYSEMARPLTKLMGKEEWSWGSEQEQAFEGLKKVMSMALVLAMPKDEDPFMIECDASEGALGAILSQKQEDKWRPVAFLSKALNPTERNYEIYDKELLAIITAFDKWQQYLIGAKEIEVFTDHQNLTYFRKPQKLNRRQARWVTELAQFNFTLKHRPGCLNSKADLPSRCVHHNISNSVNQNVTVLKEAWFRGLEVAGIDGDLIGKITSHKNG